jgi:hypothetical protein
LPGPVGTAIVGQYQFVRTAGNLIHDSQSAAKQFPAVIIARRAKDSSNAWGWGIAKERAGHLERFCRLPAAIDTDLLRRTYE